MKNARFFKVCIISVLLSFFTAVVVYGGTNLKPISSTEVETWALKEESDPYKTWSVKFNQSVDKSTLTEENVFVKNLKGDKLKIEIALKEDGKTIDIINKEGYAIDEEYSLHIQDLKDTKGRSIKKSVIMPFKIEKFTLGDDKLLTSKFSNLIDGKKIGLVTNQTGVNSKGESIIDVLSKYSNAKLTALYGPEHGIDGTTSAGGYVESTVHPTLGIPVYSLYGPTRKPTSDMLKDIDVLVFDIQDIGSRTYTFMSTMNYCMVAAKENNKSIVILDRPNPIGANKVYGNIVEDNFITFVGVDNLPMIHGMTAGELAKYFNRKINSQLYIVPMSGYKRNMVWQDTGLNWVQTSPYIPDVDAAFGYQATGLAEGTGLGQSDCFKWVGLKGLDSNKFAEVLNSANLEGVKFIPDERGSRGGVKLQITDYHTFNPGKTGLYVMAYARILGGDNFKVPSSKEGTPITNRVMFEKLMGGDKMGKYLSKNMTPQDIEATFKADFDNFMAEREKYLIYK